ncbi:hypothetical protein SAMN02745121_05858 [Nannocystis exedens]|uniref:Uncharacterized protein n=1 Tax=Nannocystis exedens TaxID=54 RepID=A0A1I2E1P6_9BACT|nr:hypothetical protein [Nannocystis exedens]PCC69213.1 hypothetical protein NAEX_02235 [Nannocystis exedens]SFE86543.1 hypothetical protein SAMN02745121_05858 [Nannocystis exedens]
MRCIRPRARLLPVALLAACFAPEGTSPTTGTTTAPGGTTTTATTEPSTAPGTGPDPATSTTSTTSSPTLTGDPTTGTSTSTSTSTSTTDATTTSTATGSTTSQESTAATTLEPECFSDMDCPNNDGECKLPACVDGQCTFKNAPVGSLCNGLADQCDAMGLCVDCVDNGGCGECCYCAGGICLPG